MMMKNKLIGGLQMNEIIEKTVSKQGLNLHFIPTKKFKTLTFVAKLRAPLKRETISKRALLPFVLRQATQSYTNRTDLQLKLDDLYGAVLSIDGTKKGEEHIISFRMEIANERYLPGEDTFTKEALQLLEELMFKPYLENEHFSEKIFNREKSTLKQRIQAIRDNKIRYANMRLIDEMCGDEAYGIHVNGYEADLDSLTNEELYRYYKEIITTDQFDFYVVGDFNPDGMENEITAVINSQAKEKPIERVFSEYEKKMELNEVIEKEPIQQAKLHIGYRTNTVYSDKDYPALQVFNGIFGGYPSSKLFINVREKNSLAYYASSQLESHKGLLFVLSGIAPEDFEQARDIIREQMQEMKTGNFTDDEIEEIKEMLIHSFRETMDNNHGLVELFYQQQVADTKFSLEELFSRINAVTKEDVVQVAGKVEEDTLYLLTSEGGEQNE